MRHRFKRSFSGSCKQSHEQPRDNERALLPSQPCCDCRRTGNGHWYSAQVQHARAADSERDASFTRRRSELGSLSRELERVPMACLVPREVVSCFLRSSAIVGYERAVRSKVLRHQRSRIPSPAERTPRFSCRCIVECVRRLFLLAFRNLFRDLFAHADYRTVISESSRGILQQYRFPTA
jgi:hypothetical protein